jgi:glycerol-3-phosphate O-acyltransferase
MTEDIRVEVKGTEIVVYVPDTDYLVTYYRRDGTHLMTKKAPMGPIDFRVRAWTLANDKARELGWIG